ncbi:hypothetical protein [Haloferula sp. A504]|uniref:hypothetical protein n=1 Tax=Haloferula sp. A504 TaxID=3373601 RepID=UPI0031CA2884|nr:hypothetical protein [Verrucomicrobiaceae bacterium E54]
MHSLVNTLINEKDYRLRAKASDDLVSVGEPAIDPLVQALNTVSIERMFRVIKVLARIKDSYAIDPLKDNSPTIPLFAFIQVRVASNRYSETEVVDSLGVFAKLLTPGLLRKLVSKCETIEVESLDEVSVVAKRISKILERTSFVLSDETLLELATIEDINYNLIKEDHYKYEDAFGWIDETTKSIEKDKIDCSSFRQIAKREILRRGNPGIDIETQVPCTNCGTLIFVAISERNAGVCTPCSRGERPREEGIETPCPKCGRGLHPRALTCLSCGFKWFKCPRCDAPWARGTTTCSSCHVPLADIINKPPYDDEIGSSQEKKRSGCLGKLFILLLVLGIAYAVVPFLLNGHKDSAVADRTPGKSQTDGSYPLQPDP